ncbi:MAG: RimK family alpha-L-glutamate ligase [Lachnospiraceae bacterium]|nr:RimK family alpha-L-glutamate ligase [Lachnospiraceae bacterium]
MNDKCVGGSESGSRKGLFIVNAFLDSPQVNETYSMLMEAAKRAGLDMRMCTNADFFADMEGLRAVPASLQTAEEIKNCSFILFWNKDVLLARSLERMGLRLFNPAYAIESCDNKALTYERLGGICRIPKTYRVPMTFTGIGYGDLSFEDFLGSRLGYPYIIKECLGSYGEQVYLAKNPEEARSILGSVAGSDCIAQEFIASSYGRDIRAYVIGDRVAASMERHNPNDFRSNITGGGMAEPHEVTEEEERMAIAAAKKLGLDFAGVDMLIAEDGGPMLCEVNSNAQFSGLLKATGINIADAISEHIRNAIA